MTDIGTGTMVRTLVDLRDSQVQALDSLAKRRDRSRASLIREAMDDYLGRHCHDSDDEAFGSWSGKNAVDGQAFEERARREW